jgi:hypothetical protein
LWLAALRGAFVALTVKLKYELTHALQDARAALCCVVRGDRMQVDGPLDDSR